jgi:ADP-ribose diphosphatase
MSVTQIRTRTAINAGLFSVEDLDVRFSNAQERQYQRLRMRSRLAVMVVPISQRNTLLLIREFAAGIGDYVIKFPTGTVEREESVEAAAVRELQEETGWLARTISVGKSMYAEPGHCDQMTCVVLARDLVRGQSKGDEPERTGLYEWPASDRRSLIDSLVDARSIAALAMLSDCFGATIPMANR